MALERNACESRNIFSLPCLRRRALGSDDFLLPGWRKFRERVLSLPMGQQNQNDRPD